MKETDKTMEKILSDLEEAREKFEFYEKVYLKLSEGAREHLKRHSAEYKQHLRDIRELIQQAVGESCSVCEMHCCMLHNQELSTYIARTVGGFSFTDYLLVRYDTILPEPDYSNAEGNLCPFWRNGCILPIDCRSYSCAQFFCDKLEKKLDMQIVKRHSKQLISVIRKILARDILS